MRTTSSTSIHSFCGHPVFRQWCGGVRSRAGGSAGAARSNTVAVECSQESCSHIEFMFDCTYPHKHGVRDHVEGTSQHVVSYVRIEHRPRSIRGCVTLDEPAVCRVTNFTCHTDTAALFPQKETKERAQQGAGDKERIYHAGTSRTGFLVTCTPCMLSEVRHVRKTAHIRKLRSARQTFGSPVR